MITINSEFNLLREKWILVRKKDCSAHEVSLTDVLFNAHRYETLAGETKAQDVAVMRLLLAILYTVFSNIDVDGNSTAIEDEDDALERWQNIWDMKQFPERPIRNYLSNWEDRFYLFDDKHPFWQVPSASIGTTYGAAKLNGELSESGNKKRLFSPRTEETKNGLTYAEAARWLLYVNGFDDTSAKPKGKNLPSPGAGWLGKMGIIYAVGNNLFETLMLNLTFLKNGHELWNNNYIPGMSCCPSWELAEPRDSERAEIPLPDNLPALLTLQSRRLLLKKENTIVTSYLLLGGDFFEKENAISEQMTIWRTNKDEKKGIATWTPRRHDPSKHLWREFSSFSSVSEDNRTPGIVSWITRLREEGCIHSNFIVCFEIVSVQYGDKDFFVSDSFNDSIKFYAEILTSVGEPWRARINKEVEKTERAAVIVGNLASDISYASGGEGKFAADAAKQSFYSKIDVYFRQWIQLLIPTQLPEEKDELCRLWRQEVSNAAEAIGKDMIASASTRAFTGRTIKKEIKGKDVEYFFSAPKAYNVFISRMRSLYKED